MKLRTWQMVSIVAALSGAGLVLGLDRAFKAEDSEMDLAPEGQSRALALAQNGFLHWRHSLFLVCTSAGLGHLVAKIRLAERDRLTRGSAEKATIFISDETRPRDFPKNILLTLDTRMTLVSNDWVDTLESDNLTKETLTRVGEVMPSANMISLGTMERGAYFDVTSRPAEMQSFVRDCVSQ
jgi:hypothetical protein